MGPRLCRLPGADYNESARGTRAQPLFSAAKLSELSRRHLGFLVFLVGSSLVFWMPLRRLINFSFNYDYASHILFIVPISAYLIFEKRHEIFSNVNFDLLPGSFLILAGLILAWFAETHLPSSRPGNASSVLILAIVIIWISGFLFFYGAAAFSIARFPLLFLLLIVPIPGIFIDKIIVFLQTGSEVVAYWLLRLLQVPVFEQGFILQLPTLSIEVAKECSGVRSSLGLLITTLLVGEFSLRTGWRKALFTFSALPILVVKNGVRIATICLLSIYVNRGFLHGWLHTSGGVVFYLLGLAVLGPILVALRKSEERNGAAAALSSAPLLSSRQK